MTPLMRSPWLRLLTTHPQLLVDHAEAYGALGLLAWQATAAGWQRRVLLAALAGCCAIVAAVLAGTAGLLWAAQPAGALPWPAGWLAIPLLPLAAALGFGWAARAKPADGDDWRLLQQQWQQDLQLLRDLTEAPR
jgi:hypothetical protein